MKLQKVREQGIRIWNERTFWHEIVRSSPGDNNESRAKTMYNHIHTSLNYTYGYRCVQVQVFYIYSSVSYTSPPPMGWRSAPNAVTANSGPQSDVQVVCGVAENNAADVVAEQMFPGESVWPVD